MNLKGFAGELRSALEVMSGACSEALELVEPNKREPVLTAMNEDIPEALYFIDSSVDNMDSFTKAILKLSRLGRSRLELVEVESRPIVERVLNSLAYQIEQNKATVKIGDLPIVTADMVSLEQIFANLLSNAVAYLAPGRPGIITVNAEQTSEETRFTVQDNGRGISQTDMSKVFAPFRRAGAQDTPGEGMGLAYVQALVRRHGGQIRYDSEVDVGTTFTFIIPRKLTSELPEK